MSERHERSLATRWVFWGISIFILLTIVATGLSAAGYIGTTVVEREVLEASYQRTAGLQSKLDTMNAQAAEIQVRLRSPDISPAERTDLEAQLASINVQISSNQRQMAQ